MSSFAKYLGRARNWFMDAAGDGQDRFLRKWEKVDRFVETRFGDEEFAKDNAVAQGFKPDATAIEEAPVPVSANATLYTVLTLLVIAILWSIFGSLDRIVVAQGKIATRTPLIVMQPFTTSRIMAIDVQPGDHVRKGQVLVSFDPAFAEADVISLQHKVRTLTAETERIEAELGGTSFATSPSDSSERQTQVQIYTQEMAAYSAEMAQRDSRVSQVDSQIKAGNSAIAGLRQQLDMAQKVVEIYQRLLDQKAGAPLDVMKAQSNSVEVNMKLLNAIGDTKKLAQQRIEIEAERR